jgi:hypothetical protein
VFARAYDAYDGVCMHACVLLMTRGIGTCVCEYEMLIACGNRFVSVCVHVDVCVCVR